MKKNFKIILTTVIIALCMLITGCKKCGNDKNQLTLKFVLENEIISEKLVDNNYTLTSSDFPSIPAKSGYIFDGWYVDSLKISEGYIITQDTTVNAIFKQESTSTNKQDGSKEYPYLISTKDDLVNFADRINHMDEEIKDKNYHKAYFKLTNDIDMSGVKFTPIGKVIEIDEETTINGFMGKFDGNNHTISNLEVNINMKTNREYYGGLFAITSQAYISNLKLENVKYYVESGSDDASRSVTIGGVVGLANLTVFENIKVTGLIKTSIFANNGAFIGGIAGEWHVYDVNQAYFAYARNCYTNIETTIGEVEGETCSLESGINGGLFGYIYNYNSTVSIINSVTAGKVYGGKYVGGLIGYAATSNVSVLDSCSYATVYATAEEVTYSGGLIGMSQGDTIIKDCFYNGPVVRGTRANSTTYLSYAGGIVGYAVLDDYEVYYTAGIACINTYYNTVVRGANNTSTIGESVEYEFSKDYCVSSLKWNNDSWKEEDNKLVPTNKTLENTTYKVYLYAGDTLIDTIEKDVVDEVYSILGTLENGTNLDGKIFYNWEMQPGSEYRYYIPVIKDMDIYGKYYDVTEISGVYTGTGVLHETVDAGIIVLLEDGTLQWINSSTVGGKYKYDGEHIIFEMYNNIGEISGVIKDNVFTFYVDAGMSGQVSYTFVKSDLKYFGEYFSDSGDIITFGGENNVSFQSNKINYGSYQSGTFTVDGDTLTITSKYLESTFSSMVLVDNKDMTFTATFISKNPNVPSLENVKFYKILSKDYSEYNLVGSYNVSYVSSSSSPIQSEYILTLNADGTGSYESLYSKINCDYYVFNGGTTIKLLLEGYASEFTYDVEGDFLYGGLNRGTASSKRNMVITKTTEGKMKAVVISDNQNVLFVNDTRSFLVKDGVYDSNAVIRINTFADKEHIYINEEEYILFFNTSEYTTSVGYYLMKVGSEVGTYTYNNNEVILDGIGNVSGYKNGSYICYDDGFIVVVLDDDTFIGFNLAEALENNKKISNITPTTVQGVWYADSSSTGNQVEKYYKLSLDGYGHAAFMYKKTSEDGTTTYQHNWGNDGKWVTVVETETSLYCDFNQYQHCVFNFYYNYGLMYSTEFGYMKTIAMHKNGYIGPMVPPTLSQDAVGSYIGETSDGQGIVFNLRQDLAGTYCGKPFTAIYDGEETIIFTIQGVTYKFNIQTLVMSYNGEDIKFTFNGEITDVIPTELCGVWSGSSWTGMGANENTKVTIEKDGTVKYESQYFIDITFDYETMTITGSGKSGSQEDVNIVITYNTDTMTIDVHYTFIYDGEEYTIDGKGLTKK